jgi:hypothetical protein
VRGWQIFLYTLKAGPAARQPHDANRGCRPHAGQGEPNRSSGREPEGSTPAAVHRSSLSGIRFWRVLPRFARRPSGRGPSRRVVVKIRGSVADQARAAVLFLQGHGQPTATVAGYVEDAIRERLERDRAELNQGEDFPRVTDHLRPVGGSAGSGLVHSGFRLARML